MPRGLLTLWPGQRVTRIGRLLRLVLVLPRSSACAPSPTAWSTDPVPRGVRVVGVRVVRACVRAREACKALDDVTSKCHLAPC